jgi:phosphopantothenoylcysteine decarboxylase/phosphopantothenate--cysteine ligase
VGELACGWQGEGRMAQPRDLAAEVQRLLGPSSLAGERVIVNAGGTREPIDAVRAITNRSSGRMGFAVAAEAARRGAEVLLVAAPSSLPTPAGVERIDVETALEMREAVRREFEGATIAILCAAVADFRPAHPAARKIKKEYLPSGRGLSRELVPNPDILAEISSERGDRIVVGFAAESHDVLAAASRKLERKGCDLLVANDVSREEGGFESERNAVAFVWPSGELEELPLLPKSEVAAQLLDRIEKLRGRG